MPTTYEELLKALEPTQAEILTKHIAGITAEHEKVVKGLNEQITQLSEEAETLRKSKQPAAEEDVLKGLSPEVRTLFEKQQNIINGLVADKTEALAKARFEKCKAIPCEEEELKNVLKTASPAVVAILEKAANAIETAALTAKGRDADPAFTGTSPDEQYAKLEKAAHTLQEENEGMTFEQAFTKAIENDPETYAKYTEGVN